MGRQGLQRPRYGTDEELKMTIAIRKGKYITRNLEELFEELAFIPGKKVFVKPNLCGRRPILPGENTSIEVMDALVDVLTAFGSEITIGHGALLAGAGTDVPYEVTLSDSGFDKYRQRSNVDIVNLDELERVNIEVKNMSFHIPACLAKHEAGTYLNLAKIKTHMETTLSLSLKNQMGLVSMADRVTMHRTDLERSIAFLGSIVRPDLSILEGYPAMEGNGPHHGRPRNLEYLIAGTDMVELDSLTGWLLGYKVDEISHISYAKSAGIGSLFNTVVLGGVRNLWFMDTKKQSRFIVWGSGYSSIPHTVVPGA
jgi:uncharacterized protein (DUF362 family)